LPNAAMSPAFEKPETPLALRVSCGSGGSVLRRVRTGGLEALIMYSIQRFVANKLKVYLD